MTKDDIFVLIHSPLVGRLTWTLAAGELRRRGRKAVVPLLQDSAGSRDPFWKQHAESVSKALSKIPGNAPVTLVAHSGAGPLLPAAAQLITSPIHAYVFVDAGIPRDGASRLDLMRSEDAVWAGQFQHDLEHGKEFPNWTPEDLHEIIPNADLRSQLVAGIRPRGLEFFTEPIPVFDGWPDAPCIYIRFSAPYIRPMKYAQQADWHTVELEAGHFHMLVDAGNVTSMIVKAVDNVG